jgi:Holliday junction resolvase RusA-like endonuclease
VLTDEARTYKAEIGFLWIQSRRQNIIGTVLLCIDVYRPRRRGDLDNCLKLVLDGLKNVAFCDDNDVVEIRARRFDDPRNPRIEVEVVGVTA